MNLVEIFVQDKDVSLNLLSLRCLDFSLKLFNRIPTIGKSREFCKGISRPGKSLEKCVLILNEHEKQFGKNSALHHVETNAIGADEY